MQHNPALAVLSPNTIRLRGGERGSADANMPLPKRTPSRPPRSDGTKTGADTDTGTPETGTTMRSGASSVPRSSRRLKGLRPFAGGSEQAGLPTWRDVASPSASSPARAMSSKFEISAQDDGDDEGGDEEGGPFRNARLTAVSSVAEEPGMASLGLEADPEGKQFSDDDAYDTATDETSSYQGALVLTPRTMRRKHKDRKEKMTTLRKGIIKRNMRMQASGKPSHKDQRTENREQVVVEKLSHLQNGGAIKKNLRPSGSVSTNYSRSSSGTSSKDIGSCSDNSSNSKSSEYVRHGTGSEQTKLKSSVSSLSMQPNSGNGMIHLHDPSPSLAREWKGDKELRAISAKEEDNNVKAKVCNNDELEAAVANARRILFMGNSIETLMHTLWMGSDLVECAGVTKLRNLLPLHNSNECADVFRNSENTKDPTKGRKADPPNVEQSSPMEECFDTNYSKKEAPKPLRRCDRRKTLATANEKGKMVNRLHQTYLPNSTDDNNESNSNGEDKNSLPSKSPRSSESSSPRCSLTLKNNWLSPCTSPSSMKPVCRTNYDECNQSKCSSLTASAPPTPIPRVLLRGDRSDAATQLKPMEEEMKTVDDGSKPEGATTGVNLDEVIESHANGLLVASQSAAVVSGGTVALSSSSKKAANRLPTELSTAEILKKPLKTEGSSDMVSGGPEELNDDDNDDNDPHNRSMPNGNDTCIDSVDDPASPSRKKRPFSEGSNDARGCYEVRPQKRRSSHSSASSLPVRFDRPGEVNRTISMSSNFALPPKPNSHVDRREDMSDTDFALSLPRKARPSILPTRRSRRKSTAPDRYRDGDSITELEASSRPDNVSSAQRKPFEESASEGRGRNIAGSRVEVMSSSQPTSREDEVSSTCSRSVVYDEVSSGQKVVNQRRRRRRSLAGGGGGYLTRQDLSGVEKEARRRSISLKSSSRRKSYQAVNEYVRQISEPTDQSIDANCGNKICLQKNHSDPKSAPSKTFDSQTDGSDERSMSLSSATIDNDMKVLFPGLNVKEHPCTSARVFAALCHMHGKRERSDSLMPLFCSLVKAELVSLKTTWDNEIDSDQVGNKKVFFSGFDYSSAVPAVDRVTGSHKQVVAGIQSLTVVLREAEHLLKTLTSDAVSLLDEIVLTLSKVTSNYRISNECTKTMEGYWPNKRFIKVFEHYLLELRDIKSFMCSLNGETSAPVCKDFVGVRYRLGDLVGRFIRFKLRQILNSIPEATMALAMPDGFDRWETILGDRHIASVFSFALQKIDEFFKLNTELKIGKNYRYVSSFFMRNASLRGLTSSSGSMVILSESDLKDILLDVKEAHTFLFGARACIFLHKLIQWPGVLNLIDEAGGWSEVESHARLYVNLRLEDVCKEEKHFVLLRNVKQFVKKISEDASRFEELERLCNNSLGQFWLKFRCGTWKAEILEKNPCIKIIAEYLRDGKKEIFPLVTEYVGDEYEEEE